MFYLIHFQEEGLSNHHIYAHVKMDHSDLFVAVALPLSLLEHLSRYFNFPLIKMCSIFSVIFNYLEYDFHLDVLLS